MQLRCVSRLLYNELMGTSNQILTDLKLKGHKQTKVRQTLIEILVKSNTPVAISEIIELLAKKDLKPNKTTVYREIDFLKLQNLISEIDFGDGKKRYEISSDHHHHIVCLNCGTIKDVPMEKDLNEEEKRIIKQLGFKPIGHSLEFFGLCSKCQRLV